METDGRIRRIGERLFVELPRDAVNESKLSEGQAVRITLRGITGTEKVDMSRAEDFAKDFTARYDEALRNLSNR